MQAVLLLGWLVEARAPRPPPQASRDLTCASQFPYPCSLGAPPPPPSAPLTSPVLLCSHVPVPWVPLTSPRCSPDLTCASLFQFLTYFVYFLLLFAAYFLAAVLVGLRHFKQSRHQPLPPAQELVSPVQEKATQDGAPLPAPADGVPAV